MPTAIVSTATSENPGALRSARTAFLMSVIVTAAPGHTLDAGRAKSAEFTEPPPSQRPPTKPRRHEGHEEECARRPRRGPMQREEPGKHKRANRWFCVCRALRVAS